MEPCSSSYSSGADVVLLGGTHAGTCFTNTHTHAHAHTHTHLGAKRGWHSQHLLPGPSRPYFFKQLTNGIWVSGEEDVQQGIQSRFACNMSRGILQLYYKQLLPAHCREEFYSCIINSFCAHEHTQTSKHKHTQAHKHKHKHTCPCKHT